MKKFTKKFLSVFIAVLMLAAMMSIQSFALELFKKPEIQSVTLAPDSKDFVSLKEIKNYFGDIDELLEEINEEEGENYTLETLPEDYKEWYLTFALSDSYFEYDYEVTFTDGRKKTVESDSFIDIIDSCFFGVEGYITYEDYLEAAKGGKDTVKITYYGYVYGVSLFGKEYEKEYEFDSQINAVDCVIKSITPVSGVPSVMYEETDYVPMDGAKLRIKYADGTSKIVEIKEVIDEYDDVCYMFDEEEIYVYDDWEGTLYIEYIDEVYTKEISYTEHPFEKVEILNCDYDEEIGVKSIEYKITFKNGTSKEYSKTFEEGAFYEALDYIDGYIVILSPYDSEYSDIEDYKVRLCVSVADVVSECVEFDVEVDDGELSFLSMIINKINDIIEFFKNLFANLFGFMAK